jgi:FtsP/CotA-like multicopper oxidase with cupredoxin domain
MTNHDFSASRRHVLGGLGAVALSGGLRRPAAAQTRQGLSLRLREGTVTPKAGGFEPAVWQLEADSARGAPRLRPGGDLAVELANDVPRPAVVNWLGMNGIAAAEALTGQSAVPSGGSAAFALPLRQAGTFLLSAQLLGDGAERPFAPRALIVEESEPVAADRDEVLLITEWRLKPDGQAIAPGTDPQGTTAAYTVNGRPDFELTARMNERLRLRIVNGGARTPIGLRIANHDVRVMAIDSQPAEPFMARDGQLVLPPGSRIDVFIDATRAAGTVSPIVLHDGAAPRTIGRIVMSAEAPRRAAPLPATPTLPPNGLPLRLDLQGAVRANLSLDPKAQWITPAAFSATTVPAFQAKRGRTVVVTITNPAAAPTVFRLHGHHFRLLDRLDDGWKPFWLDTLMLDRGQTQRIAFAAEYAGRWLMEATALDWAAPKLVRCYAVE